MHIKFYDILEHWSFRGCSNRRTSDQARGSVHNGTSAVHDCVCYPSRAGKHSLESTTHRTRSLH